MDKSKPPSDNATSTQGTFDTNPLAGELLADYKNSFKSMSGKGSDTMPSDQHPSAASPSSSMARLLAELTADGLSRGTINEVSTNLKQFEANSDKNNVLPEQVQETYKQLARILGQNSGAVAPDLRAKFVEQWSAKLANPLSARQGWHDTCGVTYYETERLMHDPEKLTRVIADALIDNKTQVPDDKRSLVGQLFFDRPTDPKTTRSVEFDAASFKPDLEAQGKTGYSDARDYADQVAQVALNTLKWNLNERSPDNWTTVQGSMKFKQCEQVHRPADSNPPNAASDASCESVEYTSPITGAKKLFDQNGYGFGGQTTTEDLRRLDQALKISHTAPSLIGGRNHIESEAELKDTLDMPPDAFPVSAFVHPSRAGFREDYLKRHPEKEDAPPDIMRHIIGIEGVNPDGTVRIYNPWGIVKDMSMHDLYQAMSD